MAIKELGHVVLYVRSVERSRHFYGDILGFHQIGPSYRGSSAAAFNSGGRTHHELLLIEVGEDATPIPEGRRVGMYHFGLKVGETDDELREVLANLVANDVQIMGASDHTVTHSLYVLDPDGNEIELYIDVQPPIWKEQPEAVLARTKPLRI
ncbi:MAG TPA: VOC family protein [Chloroflexota bacterium]|nr:VOC family protein [Chloroflexota bacterium]